MPETFHLFTSRSLSSEHKGVIRFSPSGDFYWEDGMRFKNWAGSIVLTLCFGGTLLAQEPQQAPPEVSKPLAAVAAAPPEKLILKEGADVNLKFAQDLNSKTANDDDPVSLVLDQDIKIGDVVVVKAGAKAVGTITHAKKAGTMGKAGELNMRLDYLITDTGRLRLRGTKGKESGSDGRTDSLVRADWLD
jgi:hypothetical protein